MIWSVSISSGQHHGRGDSIAGNLFHGWFPLRSAASRSRGSAIWPATADAAAVAGLARTVRAPAPWRPSKLRLLVLTHSWPGRDHVAVHAETHRATRLAPFGAGGCEDLVQAFRFGLLLDRTASRGRSACAHPSATLRPFRYVCAPRAGRSCVNWCSCRRTPHRPSCPASADRLSRRM